MNWFIKLFWKSPAQVWDEKPDSSILVAYKDAMDWLQLEMGRFPISLPDSLIDSLNMRLENYIIPQMQKRGLKL
jgi:hypothetical protein